MPLAEQEPQTKYYAECATKVDLPNASLIICGWKSTVFSSDGEADAALQAHIGEVHAETQEAFGYVRLASWSLKKTTGATPQH